MLFPQLTNMRLSFRVPPPSLLRIHIRMQAERKGEKKAPLRPPKPSALRLVTRVYANRLYTITHLEERF